MGLFNHFPYTNFHELNIDWAIEKIKELIAEGEALYAELQEWKTGTDADLAEWKEQTLSDLSTWEENLTEDLASWKNGVEIDFAGYESQFQAIKTACETYRNRAEAWAVGQIGGVDVPDTDDGYQNNAKYWAEESADSADEAAYSAASGVKALANEAAEFDATATYNAGDYVLHDGDLCQFTVDHAAGAWTGVDVKAVKFGPEVAGLKTAFNGILITGKNLCKEIWTEGYYVAITSPGGLVSNSSYKATDYYIPVKASTDYVVSASVNPAGSLRYSLYDSHGGWVDGGKDVAAFTTTADTAYVRFSIGATVTNVQLEEGTTATPYTPYTEYIDPDKVLSDDVKDYIDDSIEDALDDYSPVIEPKNTTFFYASPNLLNPTSVVSGEYVNQTNGAFTSNASYSRTGFVPVTGGQKYCIINSEDYNAGIRYAFYTSASTDAYISGDNVNIGDVGNIVTAPATAKYMVMSATTMRFPFMIARSDTKIAYQEYGVEYILPEYVLGEDLSNLIINLPSKIYATVGFETNIYYENIVDNWERYHFNINCSKGRDMERGYTITPEETDVGTYTLTIIITSKTSGSMKTASTTLVVSSASAGSGTTVDVLVLGDSTTANGTVISKLHENFSEDSMTVNTVGTLGTSPNNMEGRSGWTFDYYCTLASRNSVTNPFYNANKSGSNKFDAGYYFTQTGVTKPDWFIINLGINDVFEYTNDGAVSAKIESCITQCDGMIESIKAVSPAPNVGICVTIPPNDSQDAFGKAYGCAQTRDRYKRNNLLWAKRLIAEYDGRESEGIYLIPIHTNLDTVFNMGMESVPVNARNTDTTYQSPIANGSVHPVESGYWQIADVYTAFLKGNA